MVFLVAMACVIETSIIRLRQCYIYKLLFDFKEPVLYISISNKRECFRYKGGCGKHISKYLKQVDIEHGGFLQRQSHISKYLKQVDILISKNQALQILYLKHITLHKFTMDRNSQKFNLHKIKHIYCTVLLFYNSKQNIPYNWPTGSQKVLQ